MSNSSLHSPNVPINMSNYSVSNLNQVHSSSKQEPPILFRPSRPRLAIHLSPHMARVAYNVGLTLMLLTMMCAKSSAQSNCAPTITSLAPCLGFITGNSSSGPSSACCTQLASVIQTQTQCLCTVLNGAPQLPFVVNQTRALTLPGACKIQTTPLSPCNAAASGQSPPAAGSPLGAPAQAPASPSTPSDAISPAPTSPSTATPTSPSTPTTPSDPTPTSPSTPTVPSAASPTASSTPVPQAPSGDDGSKSVPTTNQSSSAQSTTSYPPALLFLLLLVASAFSTF